MNDTIPTFGRSLGLKLILVCALVLLMGVPALFISSISYERSNRADEVTREVSARYGGAQAVMGPIMSVPYLEMGSNGTYNSGGEFILFAEDGGVDIENFETTIRKRSLFKVPTYQADVRFTSTFNPASAIAGSSDRIQLQWEDARILVALSDLRGLREDVYVRVPGQTPIKFSPARRNTPAVPPDVADQKYVAHPTSILDRGGMNFMQAKVGPLIKSGEEINFETSISINGSQRISALPFAQSTKVKLVSDWPHPGFDGQFPPISREISDEGFTANWSVPFIARGIPAYGKAKDINIAQMMQKPMTTKLVNPVNPYQTVNRALKYSIMFIGLVFLTYFLFEIAIGVRVHAAQYILIGLAQSIFYLLLLAFSEHIGFTGAFIIAALATIGATAGYAGAVFGGRQYIRRAAMVFSAVYGLLYALMRMEDFALMVGALTSFLAIAGTMYLTRNVNWYGKSLPTDQPSEAPVSST
jgi:inner membrane protein